MPLVDKDIQENKKERKGYEQTIFKYAPQYSWTLFEKILI